MAIPIGNAFVFFFLLYIAAARVVNINVKRNYKLLYIFKKKRIQFKALGPNQICTCHTFYIYFLFFFVISSVLPRYP